MDDPTVVAFTNIVNIQDEGRALSVDKKGKVIQDVLTWICNNNPELKRDLEEGLMNALTNITGAAMPKKRSTKQTKLIENSASFTNLAGIPYEVRPSIPNEG